MTMPPIGGYYPTGPGPGPGPMTPEQSEAMIKQVVAAFKVAFPDPAVLHKGEVTAIKNELNGVTSALNLFKVEWTAFKLEPPSIWEIVQKRRAEARGEAPDQLKKLGTSAKELAETANRVATKAQQAIEGLATKKEVKADDDAVRNKVNTEVKAVNVRINNLQNAINKSIKDANQKTRKAGGEEAAAIRAEGKKTRSAVNELNNAVKGTSATMNQLKQRLDAIEQSLR
ncbi:hypothetical protein SAMN04489729_6614 [Amycolatopsis lurida]|uniref:Uncharacterized protein n=1 Tax=Amycolatopsis lurida NRRL 2430 TaxID=1460371 RepID=A0A2P2FPB7_AMYLU|nr:hypothetical protein [Amycolatopsis lurida]KFU78573.1 hypothetical protein BB31_24240 [Amycolatopsis lurida NRRL 2430]SEE18474.1 hypothetical protein SAMN04489729_6614 [Amycolatopsis lurida]